MAAAVGRGILTTASLMRIRMSGGVGRAVSEDRPYPIYAIVES